MPQHMYHGRPVNGLQTMAQQSSMYDDEDDIAQREAIATEEQNYQELSQAEKRHAARVEALRDDEIEEDDFQDQPRSLKKFTPKTRKVKHTKKGGKKAHHKKAHSVKPVAHHQPQPVQTKKAHHQISASAFENADAPESKQGKFDSEEFTKGRFDTSETLAHKGHGKRHHNMAQKKHRRHHSAPKVPQQQIAHVDEAALKQEQEEITSLKRDYNKRMASANQFDGLIHLPNGKRMFVDDGAIVGGINVYAQQHHKK